jgi:hypothetical protein
VHARLLLATPDALVPFLIVVTVLTVLWLRDRRATPKTSAAPGVIVIGVMLTAILVWFFHAGRIDWQQTGDWGKDWLYYSAARQAVTELRLPYYIAMTLQNTDQYLANPETMWAPHVVLLPLLGLQYFFVVHMTACFIAGFVALARLRRELNLSLYSFAIFALLFILNGHITSHLGQGHTQWSAYFLLPWILLCLVRFSSGDGSRGNTVTLAVTLAAMIAVGGWHVFIWSLLFTIAWCARSLKGVRFVAPALVMVGALSAYRLVPVLAAFVPESAEFFGGNPPWLLPQALAGDIGRAVGKLEWWEYDAYIGYVGFVVLLMGLVPRPKAGGRRLIDEFRQPSLMLIGLCSSTSMV